MFYTLNEASLQCIANITNGIKSMPFYSQYEVKSYTYNFRIGVHAIEITKGGYPINLFLFYPWTKGKIGSIAIYGQNLTGHFNAIKSSMSIFGMPVESVEMDDGIERFIDVHLVTETRNELTEGNYSAVQGNVLGNTTQYMSLMKKFKSLIQAEIIPMLSQQELHDIRDCRLNTNTINKLITLGQKHFQSFPQKSNEVLYCLCMAIGTIIKEYDWGNKYIQKEGMCEMSQKITNPKNN